MTRKYSLIGVITLGLGFVAFSANALPTRAQQGDAQAQPDNSANNKGDSKKGAMTADQQKETPADRDTAKKIRKSITSDSSLSTYAHNVKVIVRDGMVTLKGPVKSDEEKTAVAAKANEIAGADKVTNELSVKP
jgi:hyperosmotically inducible periplasmic protein